MTLRVSTPTSFGPEREYALSVVLGEFLGLDYRHETEPREDIRISNASSPFRNWRANSVA